MQKALLTRLRESAALRWVALALVTGVPLVVAASSPLLQWRSPVYVIAGLAGVVGLCLLLVQPLLIGGALPGLAGRFGRQAHRWVGPLLLLCVLLHIVGLWITSPPDMIDALLLRAPTAFSLWGVLGMWALFAIALVVALRQRLRWRAARWRTVHTGLALLIVISSVLHALQIEGTMGTASKVVLCTLALIASAWAVLGLQSWSARVRWQGGRSARHRRQAGVPSSPSASSGDD